MRITHTRVWTGLAVLVIIASTTLTQATVVTELDGTLEVPSESLGAPVQLKIPLQDYLREFSDEATHSLVSPNHLDIDGIRPGQRILVDISGTLLICTLSFIFKDTNESVTRYYASTAGHCVLPDGIPSTHEGGNMVFDPSGTNVFVCNTSCLLGGQLSGFGWNGAFFSPGLPLGQVTYARQNNATDLICPGEIGNDFGLIEIDPAWYNVSSFVTSTMAVWGGPTGSVFGTGTTSVLVHYGNGMTHGTTFATSARTGSYLSGTFCDWTAAVNVAGGDSGSPISLGGTASGAVLHGEQALGTITHAIIGVGTPGFGTTVDRGIMLADADADIGISLVNAGTPIP